MCLPWTCTRVPCSSDAGPLGAYLKGPPPYWGPAWLSCPRPSSQGYMMTPACAHRLHGVVRSVTVGFGMDPRCASEGVHACAHGFVEWSQGKAEKKVGHSFPMWPCSFSKTPRFLNLNLDFQVVKIQLTSNPPCMLLPQSCKCWERLLSGVVQKFSLLIYLFLSASVFLLVKWCWQTLLLESNGLQAFFFFFFTVRC